MKTLILGNDTSIQRHSFAFTVISIITAGAVFLSMCNNWWELAKDINLKFFSKSEPVHLYSDQVEKTIQIAYENASIHAQVVHTGTKNGEVGKYHFLESVEKENTWTTIAAFRQSKILAKRAYAKSKIEETKKQQELENTIQLQRESITCDPTDITKPSNLTLDQLRVLVKGTWLEGKEEALYKADTVGGINAFFCIAISTLESGHGTSDRAINRSNFYGIELMTDFLSYENCTEYFTDMLYRLYISNPDIGPDITNIGPIYCPPNPEWASLVTNGAMEKYNKIMELTEN